MFYLSIYRDCSIQIGFGGLDIDIIENVRKSICSELTRTYGETLSSLCCCRGFLALDMPTTAAIQSATMLGIGTNSSSSGGGGGGANIIELRRNKKNNTYSSNTGKKKGKKDLHQSTANDNDDPNDYGNDNDEWLKQHKALRRQALYSLLLGNIRYQNALTAPFVASAVALIGERCVCECLFFFFLSPYIHHSITIYVFFLLRLFFLFLPLYLYHHYISLPPYVLLLYLFYSYHMSFPTTMLIFLPLHLYSYYYFSPTKYIFPTTIYFPLGLPDSATCRRGIAIGEYLVLQCRTDKRLYNAVGRDAFSAALSILLREVLLYIF